MGINLGSPATGAVASTSPTNVIWIGDGGGVRMVRVPVRPRLRAPPYGLMMAIQFVDVRPVRRKVLIALRGTRSSRARHSQWGHTAQNHSPDPSSHPLNLHNNLRASWSGTCNNNNHQPTSNQPTARQRNATSSLRARRTIKAAATAAVSDRASFRPRKRHSHSGDKKTYHSILEP